MCHKFCHNYPSITLLCSSPPHPAPSSFPHYSPPKVTYQLIVLCANMNILVDFPQRMLINTSPTPVHLSSGFTIYFLY